MDVADSALVRRLRLAGTLLLLGLVVELVTLYSPSPLAFIAFVIVGASLIALGVLISLHGVIMHR